ncbi:hypothetical protein [Desulfitobacterium sp.]|uniref:hypothetical protein n=1 Tax=Desulfitobacterium sp. TaxID=49981 RepID=UPI002B20662F|nr:hypothetical protein [Desulfitobacterium sp.]MEA4903019.1 hypothetical protein [Desulfitobacterium sp.]
MSIYPLPSVRPARPKRVGIGFFTGRAVFPTLLQFYARNWKYGQFADKDKFSLNLFIAYDTTYNGVGPEVFRNLDREILDMVEAVYFIDDMEIDEAILELERHHIANPVRTRQVLGRGYAKRRNAIVYSAVKHKMDYLLFIDDDEYPLAAYDYSGQIFWQRQDILGTHLNYLDQADVTHGHHCGYISPIPVLQEVDRAAKDNLGCFLKAVSNDIISVEAVADRQARGGVDYADFETAVGSPYLVEENRGLKFISGSNLGFNLSTYYENKPLPPFYNPEGARGEDTFLSACLADFKVLKVPCYAFHDGFLQYDKILQGVLPVQLKAVLWKQPAIIRRFYKACLGWIRYKPLLLYLTDPNHFNSAVQEVRSNLEKSVPTLSRTFQYDFSPLIQEFNAYVSLVSVHFREFLQCQDIWKTICQYAAACEFPPEQTMGKREKCLLSS